MMAGHDGLSLWLSNLHTHSPSPAPDLILNLTCFLQAVSLVLFVFLSLLRSYGSPPATVFQEPWPTQVPESISWHSWLDEGDWEIFQSSQESRQLLKLLFFLQHLLCCRKLSHLRTRSKLITLGTGQVMREPKKILRANYEWLNGRHPEVPCNQCASEPLKPNYPVWSSQWKKWLWVMSGD